MAFTNFEGSRNPRLVLFCGLPGSGKTTQAKRIHAETGAIRLCPDDWMTDLGVDLFDENIRNGLEKRLWSLALELLQLRQDVIVENGLWTRAERIEKLEDVKDMDIDTELHYMAVPLHELYRRLEHRNVSGAYGTVPITREQQEGYAKLFQAPDEAELKLFTRAYMYSLENNFTGSLQE